MSPEQIEKLEDYWGVNTPPVERYLGWLSDVLARGSRDFTALPPAGAPGHRPAAGQFPVACWSSAWVLSGVLGLALGVTAGCLPGPLAGPAHPGLLPADFQHPRLLAGAPAADGLFRLAGLAADRVCPCPSAWRPGSVTLADRLRHAILPAPDPEHHRRGQHRPAHPGEDDRRDGVGLCPVCPGAGESPGGPLSCATGCGTSPCPPSHCSSPPSARSSAVRCWWSRSFPTPAWGRRRWTPGWAATCPCCSASPWSPPPLSFAGNLAADLLYGVVDPKIRRGAARS